MACVSNAVHYNPVLGNALHASASHWELQSAGPHLGGPGGSDLFQIDRRSMIRCAAGGQFHPQRSGAVSEAITGYSGDSIKGLPVRSIGGFDPVACAVHARFHISLTLG